MSIAAIAKTASQRANLAMSNCVKSQCDTTHVQQPQQGGQHAAARDGGRDKPPCMVGVVHMLVYVIGQGCVFGCNWQTPSQRQKPQWLAKPPWLSFNLCWVDFSARVACFQMKACLLTDIRKIQQIHTSASIHMRCSRIYSSIYLCWS